MTDIKEAEPDVAVLLGTDLLQASDTKVLRVMAMVDELPATGATRALMDSLRPRLAKLRPARRLRFERVLFTPFDPLIVPARAWYAGDPSLSRGLMATIAATVRAGLGDRTGEIEAAIAGYRSDATLVIAGVGACLWPAASHVLAKAPPPVGWESTGVPIAYYPAVAQSLAIVLERAPRLYQLIDATRLGSAAPEEAAIGELLDGLPEEPSEGCAMLARLILEQLPGSASVLRRLITLTEDTTKKRNLRRALDRGTSELLAQMEDGAGIAKVLAQGSVGNAGAEVRRLVRLMEDLDGDAAAPQQGVRLKTIRERLNGSCQARFSAGVDTDLVRPMVKPTAPIIGPAQTKLEATARDLRVFEAAARTLGGSAVYDALLEQAGRAVELAVDAGTLTAERAVRLLEILRGSEAAEIAYLRRTKQGAGR